MSLNGLDAVAVVEAHHAVLNDPGGWLLLKYSNRDTVDLLSRGTGGVGEARAAVEKYEEISPLFGLLQYRRKKVVLQYVPEGTSRLLQARLTVQFQSILETFSPNETVFPFKAASELTESTLASACMLHTTATSLTSDSSSSLRRSRLGGITEDVEDGIVAPAQAATLAKKSVAISGNNEAHELKESKMKKVPQGIKIERKVAPTLSTPLLPNLETDSMSQKAKGFPPREDSLEPTKASSPSVHPGDVFPSHSPQIEKSPSLTTSFDKPLPVPPESRALRREISEKTDATWEEGGIDHLSRETSRTSVERRQSSQSLRPSPDDQTGSYNPYTFYKRKKKLGPRPHVDAEGRPKTSGLGGKDQRPVANLPTTVRAPIRVGSTANVDRPDSRHSSRSVPSNFRHRNDLSSAPPLPQLPLQIPTHFRPPASIAESFISIQSSTAPKSSTVAPEKLRLMKALQMRKKQQALAKRASLVTAAAEPGLYNSEISATGGVHGSAVESSNSTPAPDTTHRLNDINQTVQNRQEESVPTTPAASEQLSGRHFTPLQLLAEEAPQENEHPENNEDSRSVLHRDSGPQLSNHTSLATARSATPELQSYVKKDELVLGDGEVASSRPVIDLPPTESTKPDLAVPLSPSVPFRFPAREVSTSKGSDRLTNDNDGSVSSSDTPNSEPKDHSRKRPNILEPVKVLSSPEASDISDDDSFIEELSYAKLEEAKPMSVARSPLTPVFRVSSTDYLADSDRTIPKPAQNQEYAARPGKARSLGGRSTSTALPQWPPQLSDGAPALVAKKGTSSGISTRIKALESFSRREASGSPPPTPQPAAQKAAPSGWSFKKRTSLVPFRKSPNMSTATSTLPQQSAPSTSGLNFENIPPSQSQPWLHRSGSSSQIDAPIHKGDSISVTARIVRDHGDSQSNGMEIPIEVSPRNLYRSPLTFEHERTGSEPRLVVSRATSAVQLDSRPVSPRTERPRFSFSSTRSSVPRQQTSDSMASRLSQATSPRKGNLPRSPSDNSSLTDERPKESRASRLMKRMSNLAGGSRRNLITSLSPNGRESVTVDSIEETGESQTELSSQRSDSVSHIVDIGDVNVQFPDTLLWKRRFMRIDDQGYLVLTPPTKETMERNRGVSRRFHLSEFQKPTLPDPEREELPWSIILDFEDGACLQCACESRYTQTQVLRMLVDAHNAYHQLYMH